MRNSAGARVLAVVLAAGAGACGGGGGGGPIPLADFHDAVLMAACRLQVLCGQMPDEATCLASGQEQPHFYASLPQLVAEGHLRYDGAKARSCLDQVNALPSCARHLANGPGALPDCAQVLVGQVAQGGDCFFSEECQSDGSCMPTDGTCDSFAQCCPGTCATGYTQVPLGGDCTASSTVCASGTTCVRSADGMSGTCQPLVSMVGASCASIRCAAWLYCEPTTQTCQPPAPEGGTCNPDLNGVDCDDPRDRCDSTGVCTARLGVRAACATAEKGCVRWATCDVTTSTCMPLPTVGETCNIDTMPTPCLGGAICDATNVCTLTPVGAACL